MTRSQARRKTRRIAEFRAMTEGKTTSEGGRKSSFVTSSAGRGTAVFSNVTGHNSVMVPKSGDGRKNVLLYSHLAVNGQGAKRLAF